MVAPTAASFLRAAFDQPLEQARQAHAAGARVVAIGWPAVPVELVRAAGFWPLVLRSHDRPTPAADSVLEPGVFSPRVHRLVDDVLGGALDFVEAVIVPRTSDEDHKAFMYFQTLSRSAPAIWLFDLLQSPTELVRQYVRERTRALATDLARLGGRSIDDDRVREEITRANTARESARRLLQLRAGAPRADGRTMMPLVGAFWHVEPLDYANGTAAVADAIAGAEPRPGPRVLLAGSPVDSTTMHESVESRGAVVVAEASPWGTQVPGADVSCEADPFDALADKYRSGSLTARLPVAQTRAWFEHATRAGIDGVVLNVPREDGVFGWDLPWAETALDRRGIPHVRLTSATSANEDAIARFVESAARRHDENGGGHG